MKSFRIYAAALLLFLGLGGVVAHRTDVDRRANRKLAVYTPQQKATHMIYLLDEDGSPSGLCTGTAIGGSTIMTAEHCIKDGSDFISSIRIDRSTQVYHVAAVGLDGRDHAILILDSPAFVNIVQPDPSLVSVGSPVYMYGDGGGVYPSRKLTGTIVDCEDPSDVDQLQGEVCFDLPAISGDSGSLVFDGNDNLVAIITYRATYKNYKSIGFRVRLNSFVPQVIVPKKKKDDNPFKGLF